MSTTAAGPGLFSSDDERAAARVTKHLLDKMPARVRREVLRGLSGSDAAAVRKAVEAAETDIAVERVARLERHGVFGNRGGTS